MLQGLRNQPTDKYTLVDYLPLGPMQANGMLILSSDSAPIYMAINNNSNQLNIDMELIKERRERSYESICLH